MPSKEKPIVTPDGRYLVVRGRLWRRTNPGLAEEERGALTRELMAARRAKGVAMRAGDAVARETARARVHAAKIALGERGPVWWTDGAPDLNRHMARTTVCGVVCECGWGLSWVMARVAPLRFNWGKRLIALGAPGCGVIVCSR